MKKIFSLIVFFSFTANFFAQDDDYVNEQAIRYSDWIYKSNIRTVLLHESSWELSPPVIELNTDKYLALSFDDLDGGFKQYAYTLVHCDAAWNPTDFMQTEYLNGFFESFISDYSYSVNTLQKYTHYKCSFPNTSMQILKSGNYIVKVYEGNEKDKPVLTKRFMVYENKVTVAGQVRQSGGSEKFQNMQEVDFSILHSAYNMTNIFADLKVVIQQNARWDNAKYGIKPMFVKDRELTFDYDDGSNAFEGGNDFRNFDIKSIRFHSERIKSIYKDEKNFNHVDLLLDENRMFKRYYQNPDINGRFLVKIQEGNNSDIEADYVYVNLFFPYEVEVKGGNFYAMGGFNDFRMDKSNRMSYNPKRLGYECTLYVKQGYYNYQYVFMEDGKTVADETMIEGNHWEAENDYTVYVYHRQQGTYYDQLIGMKRFNSFRR